MQRHIKSDHINIQYPCDKWDKSFTDQGNLQIHIKSDHQNIQHNCDKYDQLFQYQGDLLRHIKSEYQTIRFNSDKSFLKRSDLNKHRKYPCHIDVMNVKKH